MTITPEEITKIRNDFPILNERVNSKPLIYLDNAATLQMPLPVMQRIEKHYLHNNANVHRGIHTLSEKSSYDFEQARIRVQKFIGAQTEESIVFCSGTTDAINLAANMLDENYIQPGDEIIVSDLEHHSNFVPWQQLCKKNKATFTVFNTTDGRIDFDRFKNTINTNTKLVAITQVSNVTGSVIPIKEIVRIAHEHNIPVLVDGAQGIRHNLGSVEELGCDFYCFSGHKLGALTGIGVLYISPEIRERFSHIELSPTRFGGSMVDAVTTSDTTFAPQPFCYEAGTPHYVGAISLAAALDYIDSIGCSKISTYEADLLKKLESSLKEIDGLHILGNSQQRAGCISFIVDNVHPLDLATILDKMGVAVRSGQLCAQPILASFRTSHVVRVSPAFYNSKEEINIFLKYLKDALKLLQRYR